MSISGELAIVGADLDDDAGTSSGSAYAYDLALDTDGDGVPDVTDNCPTTANLDQADADGDGIGNVCENPQERIELLIAQVQALVAAGRLDEGNGTALVATLTTALNSLLNDRPNTNKLLNAFINQVNGFVTGEILNAADGQALIDTAQSIIDQLTG